MFLGLDLGTSGLRGILVTEAGNITGDATSSYGVQHPKDGWSEQDPANWIDAFQKVMSELKSNYSKEYQAIQGIGISGHMHGATCLDIDGNIVRPCILWNDTRSAKEAAELDAIPSFHEKTGNIVFPGFTAPKLVWMARHEPQNFSKIATVLLPKDYLVYWLTGRLVSEMSDASGTSWLNVGQRDWSESLLENTGMQRDQMPALLEGCEAVGTLKDDVAAGLSLETSVIIVAGAADNAASACGIGAFEEGQGFVSLGTSGVLLAAKDSYAPEPASAVHTFCHAVPDKWYQMGVILSATDSLDWLAAVLGKPTTDLAALLPGEANGPGRTRFMPYLSGERTPHNDADARGAFINLSKSSDPAGLCQAVMEGVSFALRDCLDALKTTGTELSKVLAIGGGSRSPFWLDTVANILDLPLEIPAKGDFGAAYGAARLAMIGAGGLTVSEVMIPPRTEQTINPNPRLSDAYAEAYLKYSKSYTALKEIS
ncbi:MAG: xylulokinase [Proteobacteria bacterium]|nr:xylulokinase [Pseudomonadota bacterium]